MLETHEQILIAGLIWTFIGMICAGILIGINDKKKLMTERRLIFTYIPMVFLPLTVTLTYGIWPSGSLNFLVRVIITIPLIYLGTGYMYFIFVRLSDTPFLSRKRSSENESQEPKSESSHSK